MRTRTFAFLLFIFFLGTASCDHLSLDLTQDSPKVPVAISSIRFGTLEEGDFGGRGFKNEDKLSGEQLIPFVTDSDRERAQHLYDEEISMQDTFSTNRFEYVEAGGVMTLRTVPINAEVLKLEAESLNPEIIEVIAIDKKDGSIFVKTHDLGQAKIRVRVTGVFNTVEEVYSVCVRTRLNVLFYITPYWWNKYVDPKHNCRVRYKIEKVPLAPMIKDLVVQFQDSLQVVGYCEVFDVSRSREPFIYRDTFFINRFQKTQLVKRNNKRLIRNLSNEFTLMCERKTIGYKFEPVFGTNVSQIEPYEAPWKVSEIILFTNVISDNPFVDFSFEPKCNRSTTVYDEETGTYVDKGSDDDELDEDEGEESEEDRKYREQMDRELSKRTVSYFQVSLDDFKSEKERQSARDRLNSQLKEKGFSTDSLDVNRKDAILEDIDSHKKDGE